MEKSKKNSIARPWNGLGHSFELITGLESVVVVPNIYI